LELAKAFCGCILAVELLQQPDRNHTASAGGHEGVRKPAVERQCDAATLSLRI
jgi:hypothetical protein